MAVNPPDQSPPGTVTNIDTVNAKRDVYIGSRVKKTIHVSRRKSPEEIRDATNRQRMLARVRATWISDVLDASLYAATRVELGLHEAPEAVANPWRLVLEQPGAPAQPLPPSTPMAQVFDEAAGSLLILGAPGGGKTTLLLELARTLLDRAERDPVHPIPVYFHLSSWAAKRLPLADWLIDELKSDKYKVRTEIGKPWVDGDQLLPLLDGLDEVVAAHRVACVQAINTYHQEHGLVPLAVCCRQAEYQALGTTLALGKAVTIQPLTQAQIEAYLASGGAALAAVHTILVADPDLLELLDTPLMLNVLALAYHGLSFAELQQAGIPTTRRQVFAAYIARMLARRPATARYPAAETQQWLAWLARQMVAHNQTVFYIERMQPDWLQGSAQRWYRWFVRLLGGLAFGLLGVLVGVSAFGVDNGLAFGLLGGLIGVALSSIDNLIAPAEVVQWSRSGIRRVISATLIFGLFTWLIGWLALGFMNGLVSGLGMGLFGGLTTLITQSSIVRLEGHNLVRPNQGIWQSARNGLLLGLGGGLGMGLGMGLAFGVEEGLGGGLVHGFGLGLIFGASFGLQAGWQACVQHLILRILLWRAGTIPANYVCFLDYTSERILLRKVGGGYIFIHRLLLDYFAGLEGAAPTADHK